MCVCVVRVSKGPEVSWGEKVGCQGKAVCHVLGRCCQKATTHKRQETAPYTRTHPAPFRARLTHTLATMHSVQCERTDTTEKNWPGQDERSSKKPVSIRRNERKEKTQLPTQTCLPFVHVIWPTQLLARGAQAPLIWPPTRKQNKQRSRSKPFYGAQHTPHPTQEEGLSTQLNIYTKLCTMWKEEPSSAIGEGQKRKKKQKRKTWQPQRRDNNDASVHVSLPNVSPWQLLATRNGCTSASLKEAQSE